MVRLRHGGNLRRRPGLRHLHDQLGGDVPVHRVQLQRAGDHERERGADEEVPLRAQGPAQGEGDRAMAGRIAGEEPEAYDVEGLHGTQQK